MRAVFYRCIRAVEHALSAPREYMSKKGQVLHACTVPDHYAPPAATKHSRDFLTAGRPFPKNEVTQNAGR
jgi:hypothetical protein